jgi:hypothetical protein
MTGDQMRANAKRGLMRAQKREKGNDRDVKWRWCEHKCVTYSESWVYGKEDKDGCEVIKLR